MQEPSDLGQRPSLPKFQPRKPRRGGLVDRFGGWRVLLSAGLGLIAITVALVSNPGLSARETSRPGSAPTAVGVPLAPPASAATTAQAPRPTATPSAIRAPAVPIAAPMARSAPAPVRKPGTPDPDPSTDHVIVVDGDSGAILFQRNAFEPIAPASLTKIMTAILGVEYGNLSEHVKVDVDARSLSDSTVMGLEPWFDVTVEDLLYGLMLPSGNDAALALGRYVSGRDEAFVTLMNQKAAWLGLRCTNFANPHGLDAPDHYSCPFDMVVMARYGMQYQTFRKLAAARTYDIRRSNISYTLENLNPLLWAYPGADGVKIGYTDNAGRSIVATAVKNGHRVYVALMRSEAGLVPDTTELLDWAFDSFSWPERGELSDQR